MKLQIPIIFLIIISFSNCKKEYNPRIISQVTIQEFKRDSTSIRAIQVFDENTLYYAGSKGDIGFTKDGGKTWSVKKVTYQDSIVPHFRSIAFDGAAILALSIANPALLYKYNIVDNTIELVYKEEHKNVFYDCLKFSLDTEKPFGIAVGDPLKDRPCVLMNLSGEWDKKSLEDIPVFEKGEAFFAASNTNIKIIKNTIWIVSGGKKARILKSEDRGVTWQVFQTPFVQGDGAKGIYSVDFYNKNIGIAIGGIYSKPKANQNNKAVTLDGGKTWQVVANGKNPSYKSCVQYVPDSDGKEIFAVGKTGISYSNDGGVTWKEVSKDSYYAISFVNDKFAWLSGEGKIGKLILP